MAGRKMRNTTAAGNADEQVIAKYYRSLGYNVEIARVSKGHFDRIAWKMVQDDGVDFEQFERQLVQSKRNGRPEKDYFEQIDPVYDSQPPERVWITHWTRGSRVPKYRQGTWTKYTYDYTDGIREEDITEEVKQL